MSRSTLLINRRQSHRFLLLVLWVIAFTSSSSFRPTSAALPNRPKLLRQQGSRHLNLLHSSSKKNTTETIPAVEVVATGGGWSEKVLKKIFDSADSNKDGTVTQQDVYELVLKFYIHVNRKADIPPPSRAKINYLYQQCDTDHSGRLDFQEFRRLMRTVYRRASARLLAHKMFSILCAPVMAVTLVNFLQGKPYYMGIRNYLLPETAPEKVVKVLTSSRTWTTVFTVLFVKQLGKVVVFLVDKFNYRNDDIYSDVDELIDKKDV